MQTKSSEREDITKLLHDAFVRICQLAIADCGVSVAELTLYLSVQLNTEVPQIFSTTLAETVRSPVVKDSHHAEYLAASGTEALRKGPSVDATKVDSHRDEKEPFPCDQSFDSAVHVADVEAGDFIRNVTVGSLTPPYTSKNTFTPAEDSQLSSCPLGPVSPVNTVILPEDSRDTVPLEELLAGVGESSECKKYASESPSALLESGENAPEANSVCGSSSTALLNLVASEDSLVPINGACTLPTLRSYNSDMLTRCTTVNCATDVVYNSGGQCDSNNSSFLHDCQFSEDDACSNSACISVESPFCGLCEFVEKSPTADKVSGTDSNQLEGERLSTSQNSSVCSRTANRSAQEGDTSYEDELVLNESSSCSDVHSCHIVATESSSASFCLPVSGQPVSTNAAAFIQDISLLRLYPVKYMPCTLFPDASDSSYSQQPNALSISTSSCGLIPTSANNTEFPKTSPVSRKVVSVADADRGRCF